MIDRFGKTINIAWSEHEALWVEAAMSLPPDQRAAAYRDISELTGRTRDQIWAKAAKIRDAAWGEPEIKAPVAIWRPFVRGEYRRPAALPSELRQPSKAQLMGARA